MHAMRIKRSSSPRFMLNHPALVVGLVAVTMLIAAGARADNPRLDDDPASDPNPPVELKLFSPYDMSWWSVDGGGGESTGGVFALTGAIGQPDAARSGGCGVVLDGGIWSGPVLCETPLFCDGFESGDFGAWSGVAP